MWAFDTRRSTTPVHRIYTGQVLVLDLEEYPLGLEWFQQSKPISRPSSYGLADAWTDLCISFPNGQIAKRPSIRLTTRVLNFDCIRTHARKHGAQILLHPYSSYSTVWLQWIRWTRKMVSVVGCVHRWLYCDQGWWHYHRYGAQGQKWSLEKKFGFFMIRTLDGRQLRLRCRNRLNTQYWKLGLSEV